MEASLQSESLDEKTNLKRWLKGKNVLLNTTTICFYQYKTTILISMSNVN